MTHDKLLARLNRTLTCNCEINDNKDLLALIAVVELHKPITDDDIHYECAGCGNNNPYEDCPTIQAIEKEYQ